MWTHVLAKEAFTSGFSLVRYDCNKNGPEFFMGVVPTWPVVE